METNMYFIKALAAYPYDLMETVESLNYALSMEPENPMALCLMGRVYLEQYQDYEKAIEYFEAALAQDVKAVQIYAYYLRALIFNEEYDRARKFIDFACGVKAADKAILHVSMALIYEGERKWKKALKELEKSKFHAYNNEFMHFADGFESRIKRKQAMEKDNGTKKRNKS
jgi:tetratricopeptide (TPR) repeat protein